MVITVKVLCVVMLALVVASCGGSPPPAEPQGEVVVRLRVRDDLCPAGGCEGAEEPPAEPPLCDVAGPDGLEVTSIAAGMSHMCVSLTDGHVRCWGANHNASLGNGAQGRSATPTIARNVEGARSVEAGRMHACALAADGRVWCWGGNDWGALGRGNRSVPSPNEPGPVAGLRRAEEVAVGRDHTCARAGRGLVSCWGRNHVGQLGDGSREIRTRPAAVLGLRASTIAAGGDSTCAVKSDGGVACWGELTGSERPTAIDGLTAPAVRVALGDNTACAQQSDGAVLCWGNGSHGTLGPGAPASSDTALRVEGLPPARTLSMGAGYACIVDVQGLAWCWGSTETFNADDANPRQRAGLGLATDIAVNARAACATLAAGGTCCWGSNIDGLLGTQWHPFANPATPAEWPVPLAW